VYICTHTQNSANRSPSVVVTDTSQNCLPHRKRDQCRFSRQSGCWETHLCCNDSCYERTHTRKLLHKVQEFVQKNRCDNSKVSRKMDFNVEVHMNLIKTRNIDQLIFSLFLPPFFPLILSLSLSLSSLSSVLNFLIMNSELNSVMKLFSRIIVEYKIKIVWFYIYFIYCWVHWIISELL